LKKKHLKIKTIRNQYDYLLTIWHSLEKQYSNLKRPGGKLLRQTTDLLETESSHRMFPNQKQQNLKF